MGSKAILFLCLFALVLVIASEVSARDLAETETKDVEESKYSGGDHYHYPPKYYRPPRHKKCNCCGKYHCYCCHSPAEVVNAETETKPQN